MSWIFFFFFCLFGILFSLFIKKNKISSILLLLTFFIVIFLKGIDIPDYEAYLNIFKIIDIDKTYHIDFFKKEIMSGVEYGFVLLIQFFKKYIGNYPSIFYSLFSIITLIINLTGLNVIYQNVLLDNNISKRKSYYLSPVLIMIFISYFGLSYSIVAIRAGFAMGMGLWFFYFYLNRKFIKAITCLLMGFTIHRFCLLSIFYPLIYILIPKLNKKNYLFIWAILGILMITGVSNQMYSWAITNINGFFDFFNLNYSHYTNNFEETVQYVSKTSLWNWILVGMYLVFNRNLNNCHIFVNFPLLSVMLFTLLTKIAGAGRGIDFFNIFNVLMIYDFYNNAIFNKKITKIILAIIIFVNVILVLRIWNIF